MNNILQANNPLQQYFRKPSVYLRLPSTDQAYADDVLDKNPTGEHAVYSMTALDEITVKTPDALLNGQAMVNLIQSCVPDVKNAWLIQVQDLDAVLIAIRIASGNGNMDVTSECPSCKTNSEYTLDLSGMLSKLKPGNYEQELEIDELKFKIRSITFQELNQINMRQFEIQSRFAAIENIEDEKTKNAESASLVNSLRELTTEILARSVAYVETPQGSVTNSNFIRDFLLNCDRKTHNTVRDHTISLRESSTLKPLEVKCSNCGHEYKQTINMDISNFFD